MYINIYIFTYIHINIYIYTQRSLRGSFVKQSQSRPFRGVFAMCGAVAHSTALELRAVKRHLD